MEYTQSDLVAALYDIGIRPGDVLYVRARASAIGNVTPPARTTILAALLEALGQGGTLVLPSFTLTRNILRWVRPKACFEPSTPSNSGALTKEVLKHPAVVRSLHPTHSFAAIGKYARSITDQHDKTKSAFFPVRKLIDHNAKMLLIGCNTESPGFSTVHYAQWELGLTRKHWTHFLFAVDVVENGTKHRWRPSEDPGCSRGFDKMYRHYMEQNIFKDGVIGDAYSIMVPAAAAYEIDKKVITADPKSVLCDYPDCISCRILNGYNLQAAPAALFDHIKNLIVKTAISSYGKKR